MGGTAQAFGKTDFLSCLHWVGSEWPIPQTPVAQGWSLRLQLRTAY